MEKFDVVIVGSGPGGYVCAIRCAQLGFKTALVEKYSTLGGTCLNVGCIPSKALLESSEKYHELVHSFSDHGIAVTAHQFNFSQFIARAQGVVKQTCDGVNFLMKKNKIKVYHGTGSFVDKNTLQISSPANTTINFERCVIATGSKPSSLPGITIDKQRIITSTEALKLQERPQHLIVIGGGVIGLELGQVYARLGTKVSVVEYMDSLIPTMDRELGKELKKVLQKEKMDFYLQHAVQSVTSNGTEVTVQGLNPQKQPFELKGDYCLVSVGRRPYTKGLNLENVGITVDKRGKIPVNSLLQSTAPGIYAIGDVIEGPMLAHKAEEEGVFVAELMKGQKPHLNYNLIPGVVYTWPEVSAVGKSEEDLKKENISYKKGLFPFKASGRARAGGELNGFIKVLAHTQSDEILGVHMIGPRCADLIAEAVVAMEYRASAEDVARTCHAHPTYTEVFKEACLMATENRAIHI